MFEWAGLRSVVRGYRHVSPRVLLLLPFSERRGDTMHQCNRHPHACTNTDMHHQQHAHTHMRACVRAHTHTHQWSHQYCHDPQGIRSIGKAFICWVCECLILRVPNTPTRSEPWHAVTQKRESIMHANKYSLAVLWRSCKPSSQDTVLRGFQRRKAEMSGGH